MSGRVKQRAAANAIESSTISINEKILRECHLLYTDPENGLMTVAESLGLKLQPPRKKIVVMLMGNHSAGKSSFINWYIEEHVLRTGVAIETQGFTIVTSGRKRESLTGNATMHLYPYFKPLLDVEGVIGYLSTEISTSKQKKFSLVTFVDTPGLVDGDMKYPFDVNEAIYWLGGTADLIFVFFDPIGQALCKRTLNLVEKLNEKHADHVRFFLSKADEAGHESDRQRVLMQIVQELCKRPGLNKCGFDMPTIYLPNPNRPSRCTNQIEDVCKDIEKTIQCTVQKTLNALEKDCDTIAMQIDKTIEKDDYAHQVNLKNTFRSATMATIGLLLPVIFFLSYLTNTVSTKFFKNFLGETASEILFFYMSPLDALWQIVPHDQKLIILTFMITMCAILLMVAKWTSCSILTMKKKEKKILLERREYIQTYVMSKKQTLYKEYLQQSVGEQDQ